MSGFTVSSGVTQMINSGQTSSGITVLSGGTEIILSGGVVNEITVDGGGTLELFGDALVSGTTVLLAGATEQIGSGNTLSGFTVSSGVTLEVSSSGFVSNTPVLSGGTLLILSGGSASGTVVLSGGVVSGGGAGGGPRTTVRAGFDTSAYPGDATMAWLKQNTNLTWVGYYLYPAPSRNAQNINPADNSWMGHYAALTQQGWTVASIYVGEQDPTSAPGSLSTNPTSSKGVTDGNTAASLLGSRALRRVRSSILT